MPILPSDLPGPGARLKLHYHARWMTRFLDIVQYTFAGTDHPPTDPAGPQLCNKHFSIPSPPEPCHTPTTPAPRGRPGPADIQPGDQIPMPYLSKATAAFLAASILALAVYISSLPLGAADYRPGPYAGIELGASSEQLSQDSFDLSKQGVQAGGVAGWTFRTADLVLGFEGAFGWNGVTGKWGDGSATVKSDGSWRAGLRARAGVPFGPALMFVTAGPTFQHLSTSVVTDGSSFSDSKLLYGIAAGAGVDLQITHTLALRISGEHTWWKGSTANFGEVGSFKTTSEDTRILGAVIFNLD